MKYILFLLLNFVILTCRSSAIDQKSIIPEFYKILTSREDPSIQNENDFFGGKESAYVRTALEKLGKYPDSDTPIWDFIRDNKFNFISKGVDDLEQARIHYSEPFHTSRIWNGSVNKDWKVYVMFPTERNSDGSSSGLSTVIFTLGEESHIAIGETLVSGSVELFSNQIYGVGGNELQKAPVQSERPEKE